MTVPILQGYAYSDHEGFRLWLDGYLIEHGDTIVADFTTADRTFRVEKRTA